ncbi:hypothetical protein DIE10_36190 [Burkholderia sp. Bp9011]|nr:hypothetical protein DIE10_36190 [Burkholderia sp. Bp9011]
MIVGQRFADARSVTRRRLVRKILEQLTNLGEQFFRGASHIVDERLDRSQLLGRTRQRTEPV